MSLHTSNSSEHPALDAAKTTCICHTNEEVAAEHNEKALKKNAVTAQKNSGRQKTIKL